MTLEHFHTLLSWSGPQTQGLGDLLHEYRTPSALFAANWQSEPAKDQLSRLPKATQAMLLRARKHWPRRNPRAVCEHLQGAPSDAFIPIADKRYPERLKEIPDPPPWLFCRGDPACLSQPAVAIVGSRRASHAGLRAAQEVSQSLASAGYTVCSGLALGIDAAAHRGALEGGSTAAVLASGVDRASPHRHRRLAEDITKDGCLLSELPAGTPPAKHQFPRRNRIISGLAQATIIIEAALPSGSLHTAAAALEQGREVFTLPWSIFHEQGAGCRRLLRDGATPITAMEELSSLFPGVAQPKSDCRHRPSGVAAQLLQTLGDEGLSLQILQKTTALPVPELLGLLSDLEVRGWLRSVDGCYYRNDCKSCQRQISC